ncbi:MAG TPA: PT domain-containing protein [Candidatus Galloscillospira stercoripullorum]|nr:PT domain-containing protein [Candidatus Galloscillospira stercoripullorum]
MPTRHYWNLVDYGEGWYHFDACPHLLVDPAFECFMATDQELLNFDAGAGREYYSFDADAYPERVGGPADPDAVVPMPDRRPKPTATVAPTVEPTVEPTTAPTAEPAVEPTAVPTAEPAVEPTAAPVTTPAPEVTPAPEATPAPQVSAEPTVTDTPVQTPEAQGEGQSQGENADAQ